MTQDNDKIDLSHVRLQIATPAYSGYDRGYRNSLIQTIATLRELGAEVSCPEVACADLGFARAKLFGYFLRSDFTHQLSVDADMKWDTLDVVRMLLLKKDFIAAVGQVKQFPPRWALCNNDDEGNVLPLVVEAESGLVPITEIGMAFVMITKNCAERMAEAYQELHFTHLLDEKEPVKDYGVFDTLYVGTGEKRRRLSEDYAFCHRWRKIGGTVYLLPDVTLGHAGRHVWEGNFLQDTNRKNQEKAEKFKREALASAGTEEAQAAE